MSAHTDEAMDLAFHYEPVSLSELKLVECVQWGMRDLAWLRHRLGARATFVLSRPEVRQKLRFTSMPVEAITSRALDPTGIDLTHVTLAELLAELDRRSCG